jgi:hypothetical protein
MSFYENGEMPAENKNIVMILNGLPGVGKTSLAYTAKDPVLLAFDDGYSRVTCLGRKPTLLVENYEELQEFVNSTHLDGKKTLIFDSGGQFVECLKDWVVRVKKECKKDGTISLQGYGSVKREFVDFTEKIRKRFDVIYVFHTLVSRDNDGNPIYDLMCEGQTSQTVWIPADLGAYMDIISGERKLHFAPSQFYSAKKSFGVADLYTVPEISIGNNDDFLAKLFAMVRENIAKEQEATAGAKAEYESIMQQANVLIESIVDVPTLETAIEVNKNLPKALTSEKEIKTLLSAKCKELGIVWDKEKKQWEKSAI